MRHHINSHTGFVVVGHKDPDGDCIGSQIGVARILRALGKACLLLSPGPFDRPEISLWQSEFHDSFSVAQLGERPAAVVVDCSSADRIEPFSDQVASLSTLVIDHHTTGSPFGDVHLIRPEIPANVILVAAVAQALEVEITPEMAQALFLGLATDTGFFRFVDAHTPVVFEAAALLCAAGASPREVSRHLSAGRSWESRALIARMLDRVEHLDEGRVLLTWQSLADEREFGKKRDSDTLYRLLLDVEGVEAIAVVKEKDNGCTVSFRSTERLDVARHAQRYGGGGHVRASGAFIPSPLIDALAAVRSGLAELASNRS